MCGIWVYMIKKGCQSTLTDGEIYSSFMRFRHRGPDKSILLYLAQYGLYIGFHRLSIMDTSSAGDQPFVLECPQENKVIYLVCNGEIFNYVDLCQKYGIVCKSRSDCEVIIYLYKLLGIDRMIKELRGEFSFCIAEIDKTTCDVKLIVGRDQAGTRMLDITGNSNEIIISSELKGDPFLHRNYVVEQFKPRHYAIISNTADDLSNIKYECWLDFKTILPTIFDYEEAKRRIRKTLIETITSSTMGDREFCCLVSGGVDSSLVASILAEYCAYYNVVLHTFSIGLDSGSTDRPYAEMVAKHIGSIHHHIIVTEEECLNALDKIPGIIESIDITSNRASCLQYLIMDWISKNTDYKIVFCGDGVDEVFLSYKYCHYIESPEVFHNESVRLVEDIHMYDGLRAGMCATACGLEIRFVFLSKEFISLVFSIDPVLRMPYNQIEKYIFRDAFSETNYLPMEVLFRSKEALSDGCSKKERSWFVMIGEHVEKLYSNSHYESEKTKYTHMPIVSKESFHYRKRFEDVFGTCETTQKIIPYYWLPRFVPKEFGEITEPSARILSVYKTTTDAT